MSLPLFPRVLALAMVVGLGAGCPKKVPTLSLEDAQNPTINFQTGVTTLTTPNREGVIDYALAYERFVTAESLGAGKKASYNAGYVAEILDRPADALTHYQRAYEADKDYEPARHALARMLTEGGRAGEAVAIYQDYATRHPDDADARIELIGALGRAERYADAEAEAAAILLTDNRNVKVYQALSSMYHAKGDFGMAALCSEKALSLLETADPGTLNNMAVADLITGENEVAIGRLKEALEADPNLFEPNLNLGFIALNSGDYRLAMDTLTRAAAANPTNLDVQLGLAVANRGLADYERADAIYAEIIKADPDYSAAYFNAATLHEKYTRNYPKAIKYLESYIASQGGTVAANDPVNAALERVRASKAEEEARRAAEAERRRLEEERRARNAALLTTMATTVTTYRGKFQQHASCLPPEVTMEGEMMLEQAQMVVDAQEADMAADIQMLLEGYVPTWDAAIAGCEGGGAPAPAPEPTPQ
jgi:tetratricopeptide (TPR) repeat protein